MDVDDTTIPTREMTPAEKLYEIFSYHAPTADQLPKYEQVRAAAREFARVIVESVPPGSDRSAAVRHVREAVMTANAGIALRGANFS